MTFSKARPDTFLHRRISSKARRRVQNLPLLTLQQRDKPSRSIPRDVTFCPSSDLWRLSPFPAKGVLHWLRTVPGSCSVFAITPRLSTYT